MTRGSAEDKERVKKGLAGLLETAPEERQKRILSAVKENLLLVYVLPRTILFKMTEGISQVQ